MSASEATAPLSGTPETCFTGVGCGLSCTH